MILATLATSDSKYEHTICRFPNVVLNCHMIVLVTRIKMLIEKSIGLRPNWNPRRYGPAGLVTK